MILRVVGIGSPSSIATFRYAAELSDATTVVAYVAPEQDVLEALADVGHYDAVCILDPAPRLIELVHAHGVAGTSVLIVGPPTEDLTAFDQLAEVFNQSGAALVVGGVLRHKSVCRTLCEVAAQLRIGAPVYLRYAAEVGVPSALFWRATDAIDLATHVLGDLIEVYAVSASLASGDLVHLALTLRHQDGSVALLGLGAAEGTRGPGSILLLGDLGAVEDNPAAGGLVVHDGVPQPSVVALRDERVEDLAAWLRAASAIISNVTERQAELIRGRHRVAALAAVRRSLARGRPEPLGMSMIDVTGAQ